MSEELEDKTSDELRQMISDGEFELEYMEAGAARDKADEVQKIKDTLRARLA